MGFVTGPFGTGVTSTATGAASTAAAGGANYTISSSSTMQVASAVVAPSPPDAWEQSQPADVSGMRDQGRRDVDGSNAGFGGGQGFAGAGGSVYGGVGPQGPWGGGDYTAAAAGAVAAASIGAQRLAHAGSSSLHEVSYLDQQQQQHLQQMVVSWQRGGVDAGAGYGNQQPFGVQSGLGVPAAVGQDYGRQPQQQMEARGAAVVVPHYTYQPQQDWQQQQAEDLRGWLGPPSASGSSFPGYPALLSGAAITSDGVGDVNPSGFNQQQGYDHNLAASFRGSGPNQFHLSERLVRTLSQHEREAGAGGQLHPEQLSPMFPHMDPVPGAAAGTLTATNSYFVHTTGVVGAVVTSNQGLGAVGASGPEFPGVHLGVADPMQAGAARTHEQEGPDEELARRHYYQQQGQHAASQQQQQQAVLHQQQQATLQQQQHPQQGTIIQQQEQQPTVLVQMTTSMTTTVLVGEAAVEGRIPIKQQQEQQENVDGEQQHVAVSQLQAGGGDGGEDNYTDVDPHSIVGKQCIGDMSKLLLVVVSSCPVLACTWYLQGRLGPGPAVQERFQAA